MDLRTLIAFYELGDAGVVTTASTGYDVRYGVDHARWAALLDDEGPFPIHVDWLQLLGALTRFLRWLRTDATNRVFDAYSDTITT